MTCFKTNWYSKVLRLDASQGYLTGKCNFPIQSLFAKFVMGVQNGLEATTVPQEHELGGSAQRLSGLEIGTNAPYRAVVL
jgi:hypothetical protein